MKDELENIKSVRKLVKPGKDILCRTAKTLGWTVDILTVPDTPVGSTLHVNVARALSLRCNGVCTMQTKTFLGAHFCCFDQLYSSKNR